MRIAHLNNSEIATRMVNTVIRNIKHEIGEPYRIYVTNDRVKGTPTFKIMSTDFCYENLVKEAVSEIKKSYIEGINEKIKKESVALKYIEFDDTHDDSSFSYKPVTLFNKPCHEFEKLRAIIAKRCGLELNIKDFYNVAIYSRNDNDFEETCLRKYYHSDSRYFLKLLNWIRRNKNQKDVLKAELITFDEIEDESGLAKFGFRYSTLKLTVLTPGGKVKSCNY